MAMTKAQAKATASARLRLKQKEETAPEVSGPQQALRAAEFGSRGFMDTAAETVGAIPELAASGLRAIGLPAPESGYYPEANPLVKLLAHLLTIYLMAVLALMNRRLELTAPLMVLGVVLPMLLHSCFRLLR